MARLARATFGVLGIIPAKALVLSTSLMSSQMASRVAFDQLIKKRLFGIVDDAHGTQLLMCYVCGALSIRDSSYEQKYRPSAKGRRITHGKSLTLLST